MAELEASCFSPGAADELGRIYHTSQDEKKAQADFEALKPTLTKCVTNSGLLLENKGAVLHIQKQIEVGFLKLSMEMTPEVEAAIGEIDAVLFPPLYGTAQV